MAGEARQSKDWIDHTIQAGGIVGALFLGLGLPLLIWGSNTNAIVATLSSRQTRVEADIVDLKAAASSRSDQLSHLNAQLATISAQIGYLREDLRSAPPPNGGGRR